MDSASTGAEPAKCDSSSSPSSGFSKNRGRCETLSTTDGTVSFSDCQHAAASAAEKSQSVEDVPRWVPRCCGKPFLHGNVEALGFLFGMV